MDGALNRAAVLGSPIRHSLSPTLHRAGYAAAGLTGWSYQAIECEESGLPGLLADLDSSWRGLSLTMPLKRAVLPLLAQISPLAMAVGAVNTVTWTGPDRRPCGENTDVTGLLRGLAEVGIAAVSRTGAVVLGAGGTACAALAALRELGCTAPTVQVRSTGRAADLMAAADRLGVHPTLHPLTDRRPALAADLVLCTLPVQASATWAQELPPDQQPAGLLLDVVYQPWPTPAAAAWSAAGGRAEGGFGLLLHQAAEQFELMTGLAAPVAAMRAAGMAVLGERVAGPA